MIIQVQSADWFLIRGAVGTIFITAFVRSY